MTLCGSKVSRRATLALVPLIALLLSDVGHATPATAITTCGFSITRPGEYYLANDLLGCPGVGIEIFASRVNLRLDGHTIQGSGHGSGIDVVGQMAILIQGPGTITGFPIGLRFVNVALSSVIGVTATGNDVGFEVIGNNNLLQGNVAADNRADGIDIVGGNENKLVNNLVTNNQEGIVVIGDSNMVQANTVTGNEDTGIVVGLFSEQNIIAGNTALDNGSLDMHDRTADCDNNKWRGNRFVTAFPSSCIQ